jgi:hypothetical protein
MIETAKCAPAVSKPKTAPQEGAPGGSLLDELLCRAIGQRLSRATPLFGQVPNLRTEQHRIQAF